MRAANFVAVLFSWIAFLWSPALSQCPEPTKSVLTDLTLDQVTLEATEGVQYDSVEINDFNINCLAAASTRGYIEAVVTVNFTTNTGLMQTFQLLLDCFSAKKEWRSPHNSVSLPRDVAGMTLTTEGALNYETDVSCTRCGPDGNRNHPSFCKGGYNLPCFIIGAFITDRCCM